MAGLPPRASWDDEGADTIDNASVPSAELDTTAPNAPTTPTAPRQPSPARWSPTVRPGSPLRRGIDPATWPVGFSPTGEALPETLTDVLLRGSHAIRSSKRAEALRLERAAAIADHVEAQILDFLTFCATEDLVPPVIVRTNGRRPDRAWESDLAAGLPGRSHGLAATEEAGLDQEDGQEHDQDEDQDADDRAPGDDGPAGAQDATRRPPTAHPRVPRTGTPSGHRRRLRRERLQAWPLLYWRCESFPAPGRSLHLFVEPGGRTFEGRDDPAPLTVLGREVRVWQVDAPAIVAGMAEVDARRCALHLVHGMAHMLWQAGVGL
ncbi:hypothetical protein CC117_07960 [Parafrankia colletiae]|uniref:Uncharacterized protein n=1 Tax=Parafrankia colletiae TaxID=573497 RepID=A0A1S1Q869_9ACTN|nr:hypothetical protein [Parafrankia colletiae]MCK9898909.1 hypothetical protein [Frankia sp. Cpl3]OHV29292.1 hypothetical protein CC117_07960 [Parafrankia colletiae]